MNAPFERIEKKNSAVVNTVVGVTGIVTTAMSYKGAVPLNPTGDLLDAAAPALYAIGTGALVWGHYKLATDIMPKCQSAKGRLLSGAVMAVGLAGLVTLSSPLNLSAMKGEEALTHHMQRSLPGYGRAVEESLQRAMLLEGLIPVITVNADRLERNAQEEKRIGKVSNVPGTGAISETIEDGSHLVRSYLNPVNKALNRAKEAGKDSLATLEKARQISASDKDAGERMRAFARQIDLLRATLVEMDVTAVAGSIEQLGLTLPESIVGRAKSNDPRIAKAQDKSMATILKNFRATGNNIAAAAGKIANLPKIKVPEFERISRTKASLRYVTSYLPVAIGSVMLDCAPVLMCLWLMVARANASRSSEIRMRSGSLTLDEMLDAQDALSLLTEQRKGSDLIGRLLSDDPEDLPPDRKSRSRRK